MITKEMYRFLSHIPIWPNNVPFDELPAYKTKKKYMTLHLLMAAQQEKYVGFNGEDSNSGVYLSEKGQEAKEEYKRQAFADTKATIAIILSIITIAISIIGWFLPVQ